MTITCVSQQFHSREGVVSLRPRWWMVSILWWLAWGSFVAASQAPSNAIRGPAFEVASVKQNTSGDTRAWASPGLLPTPFGRPTPEPGRIAINNVTLRELIAAAYDINPAHVPHLLAGGSGKLLDLRFDIQAQPPEGAPASETLMMLRALLAERFKLKVHTERRDVPVYALLVARQGQLGRLLRPSKTDCSVPGTPKAMRSQAPGAVANPGPVCMLNIYQFGKPGRGDITMSDTTPLTSLIVRIQPFVDRPLLDATGLAGSFEWSVSFAMNADSTTAPPIYSALSEQLGIRVERRTAPFDVLVIDSVETPTPN